jgi:hypothetical protein
MDDIRKQLPAWAWVLVGVAVLVVLGEMAGGYAVSFHNLEAGARQAGWRLPWLLPLQADAPILAYVVLDQIAAVMLGARGFALHVVAWLLAAFTIWANYQLAPGSSEAWKIIFAACAAGWVLGVEGLRYFWRLLRRGPRVQKESAIPGGRWVADPFGTRRIQWRMWKLGERSWPRMAMIEDARAFAEDVVREMRSADRVAPEYLTDRIHAARLPGPVLAAIDAARQFKSGTAPVDDAVRDWVAGQMVLSDVARIRLQQETDRVAEEASRAAREEADRKAREEAARAAAGAARRAADEAARIAAEEAAQTAREEADREPPRAGGETSRPPAPDDPPKRPAGPSWPAPRKPTAAQVKTMSGEDLAAYVRTLLADRSDLTVDAVMAKLHIGRPKAREALAAAEAPACPAGRENVIAFGAR